MTLIDPILLQARPAFPSGRFDVDVLEICDSSNSELMRRAEQGAPGGMVVVADRQSAGRGRRGRTWLSAAEDSLTFSLLWRFAGSPTKLTGLSLAIGLAITRGLEKLGAQGVCLKWPNDVLLRQGEHFAKLAGILIETSIDRRGTQAIIGIGLNLKPPADDLPQPAAGLSQVMPLPERHDLLATLLAALAETLDAFAVDGFSGLKSDWQSRHAWQGQRVQMLDNGIQQLDGICLGVDADGALLLETSAGIERVFSGDLSLRRL